MTRPPITILLTVAILASTLPAVLSEAEEPENQGFSTRLLVNITGIDQYDGLATLDIEVYVDDFPHNATKIRVGSGEEGLWMFYVRT